MDRAFQANSPFRRSRAEGWILWRRIAGGLAAGQQQALAEPLIGPIRGLHKQLTTGKGRGGDLSFASRETAEMWRLLGSLEMLPVELKIELGTMLLDLLPKRKIEPVRQADHLGRGPDRGPGADVRSAECDSAGRNGRGMARSDCWTLPAAKRKRPWP